MAGLYEILFGAAAPDNDGGMDSDKTNAHWKREEDNYHSQIGLFGLLDRDPVAREGYERRKDPEMKTLKLGGDPGTLKTGLGETRLYGVYRYKPQTEDEGRVSVDVGLNPNHYGQVLAHELGHVGSRYLSGDTTHLAPEEEELRQRNVDLLINEWPAQNAREAAWYLNDPKYEDEGLQRRVDEKVSERMMQALQNFKNKKSKK